MSKTVDQTSLAEVFIQFQIQVKRNEIQDYKQEMCQLEDKKLRLMKLQEQLKEEQSAQVCELRKQMKEQDRNLEQKQLWNKEQVEHALQENLELKHNQENELEELHCKLARLQVQVDELRAEVQVWLQYKNEGNMENQQKIQKLETDIAVSQSRFQEMSEYIQRSLAVAAENIDRMTAQSSNEIKQLAKKRTFENLDSATEREIRDNDWLKEEFATYCKEISVLESTIQELEKENLEHVNKLLTAPLDDPKISPRKGFCGQTVRLESYDTHGMNETIMQTGLETTPDLVDRPPCPPQPLGEAEGAQQERDVTPTTPPDLSEILYRTETNFTGLMHLDSLEQKLLCVVGKTAQLHQPPSEPTDGSKETPFSLFQTKESVVTTRTIQRKIQQLRTSTQTGESNES